MQTDHWASQNSHRFEALKKQTKKKTTNKEEEEEETKKKRKEKKKKEHSGAENSSLQWCYDVFTGKWLPMSPKIVTPPSSDSSGIDRNCGLFYPKMEALRSTKTLSQELEVNDKLIPYFRALTLENRNKTADNSEVYVVFSAQSWKLTAKAAAVWRKGIYVNVLQQFTL
jgi:hypothetical protein